MTLTKEDLKDSICNQLNIPKTQSRAIIESFLETIKSSLKSGEDVMISGFGKFSVKNKNERRGRNPATGENLMLGPRKVVGFKCSDKLRDKVNRAR
jgi:integration host factor subunit alpha